MSTPHTAPYKLDQKQLRQQARTGRYFAEAKPSSSNSPKAPTSNNPTAHSAASGPTDL